MLVFSYTYMYKYRKRIYIYMYTYTYTHIVRVRWGRGGKFCLNYNNAPNKQSWCLKICAYTLM